MRAAVICRAADVSDEKPRVSSDAYKRSHAAGSAMSRQVDQACGCLDCRLVGRFLNFCGELAVARRR